MNFQPVKDRNQAALARLQRCLISTAPTLSGVPRGRSQSTSEKSQLQESGSQEGQEHENDIEADDRCTDEAFKVVVGTYAYFTFAFIDQGESGETVWLRSQVSVLFQD
jgi:hypothetical protein